MINIEMFPANEGDCILIKFNDVDKTNILIDSGYAQTYNNFLKERFIQLNNNGESISLFVITHLHGDHIAGGIKFLEENVSFESPTIIRVDEIWHNSFKHLQFNKRETSKISSPEEIILKSIISKGIQEPFIGIEFQNKSAIQGSSFAALILQGGYKWNEKFNNDTIFVNNNLPEIYITKDIKLTLLSPTLEKLKDLDIYWRKELNKLRYGFKVYDDKIFDDAFEFFMAQTCGLVKSKTYSKISKAEKTMLDFLEEEFQPDDSIVNASSLAFMIEYKKEKLLFLGDAHSLDIENGIKQLKQYRKDFNSFFNCIKISHHGSKNNTSPTLLDLIDSNNFLISTDGNKHNHPDIETIARIVCRETKTTRNLFFNYKTSTSDYSQNEELMKKHKYSALITNKITL